ncbi:MAG: ABC transporter permease [Gemmatimonadetes bacterium]|nr:ABC transporter permease [Gemmatimonadota bacterium]
MSRRDPRPPALSRLILEWAAGRLGVQELADDARDLFVERALRDGEGAARRWYRRQAGASLGRLLLSRRKEGGGRPGTTPLAGFSLDARLGARMLAKHPGVTLVGGLAMTIGIGLGAAYLEVLNDVLQPTLPFEEGERIVGVENWDVEENDPELRSMHDFLAWRAELTSVRELGAFRSIERNLGPGEGVAEPARGAEITPAAFRTVRVPALIGRPLLAADEREGAPPVIVLGHDLWRSRFAGDAGIVGRTVQLDDATSTVVGVMPPGFGFPVSHDFWVPLRAEAWGAYGPREGPPIRIFGRLAPGVTMEEARAEVRALGLRAAADLPATHARLRPRVVGYADMFIAELTGGGGGREAYLVEVLFLLLLLILASNVATMVFARTATRENEIAVRFALGSSRGRILGQFFVEALVLALAAAAVALAVVAWGTDWLTRFMWQTTRREVPFWLNDGIHLNLTTVAYALALAVLAALVAGVVPALKATASGLQARLRDAAGAGASSLRFGGLWSVMTVVQVTLAVLVLPPAVVAIRGLAEPGYVDPGFPGEEYLSTRLAMDLESRSGADAGSQPPADSSARAAAWPRFQATYEELERRLLAEPEVSEVTFATRLPVMNHPQPWLEADLGGDAGTTEATWVNATSVDVDFFDTFGAEIVAGRGFNSADLEPDARIVVVNEHFVERVLQGRNALGRRVRYTTRFGQREAAGRAGSAPGGSMREPGEWHEIVGVVDNLGMDTNKDAWYPGRGPGVYHPLIPEAMGSGGSYAVRMAFHVRGDAASFAPRLRELAHAVDPRLRLSDVLPLDGPIDDANRGERVAARFVSWTTALVGLIALLVSMAGTYSVMAFTVSRQTRAIGIRIALGADRQRIVQDVFSRAMIPIGVGILVGALVWLYLAGDEPDLLLTSAGVLLLVGLVACGVPVRRALRIEPTEALREVG